MTRSSLSMLCFTGGVYLGAINERRLPVDEKVSSDFGRAEIFPRLYKLRFEEEQSFTHHFQQKVIVEHPSFNPIISFIGLRRVLGCYK